MKDNPVQRVQSVLRRGISTVNIGRRKVLGVCSLEYKTLYVALHGGYWAGLAENTQACELDGIIAGRYNSRVYDATNHLRELKLITEREFTEFRDWLRDEDHKLNTQAAIEHLKEDARRYGFDLVKRKSS